MIKMYDYWRSSACYRLRIGFNLKGISYESVSVNLHPDVREHVSDRYKAINPQQRVPAVEIDGQIHTQSMAILDWMDMAYPEPAFLPEAPHERLKAKAFAETIACDIHPLNNMSVTNYLQNPAGVSPERVSDWYAMWVDRGFSAIEQALGETAGSCCFGDTPTVADACLVPQVYNALRFEVDTAPYPKIMRVWEHCNRLEAFERAHPDRQPDSPAAA